MNYIDILKIQSDPVGLGVSAPDFIWWAAAILLLIPLCVLIRLFWLVRKKCRNLEQTASAMDQIRSKNPAVANQGLSAMGYDNVSQLFANGHPLRSAWDGYASLVVRRRSGSGEEQNWATESAAVSFSEILVFERGLNRSFYAAVPGVVTGVGLLFTFLAILVALLEVDVVNNQVKGLELLIHGLSGKFISSIAALFSATIFTVAERLLLPRLTKSRLRLVESLDALVPRLSPVRVLAELPRYR